MARRSNLPAKGTINLNKRPQRLKKYQYVFLIVCEDQKTEPNYFSQFIELFPDKTLYLKPVGSGKDPLGVVENAVIEKKKLNEEGKREVDYVWVVFDRDDAHLQESTIRRFNEALSKAKINKFEVACSNEVFELWLLLHLEDICCLNCPLYPPICRNEIYERLEKAIRQHPNYTNYIYNHRKPLTGQNDIVTVIQEIGNESKAIERAKVLLKSKQDVPELLANPSTKVYLLITEIRKWIDYFKI